VKLGDGFGFDFGPGSGFGGGYDDGYGGGYGYGLWLLCEEIYGNKIRKTNCGGRAWLGVYR